MIVKNELLLGIILTTSTALVGMHDIKFKEEMAYRYGCEDESEHYEIIADASTKKLVGYAKIDSSDPCHIYSLFVEESFRNKGIGRALLERAVAYSKRNGCKEIRGEANETISSYFEKLGATILCHRVSGWICYTKNECLPPKTLCNITYKLNGK